MIKTLKIAIDLQLIELKLPTERKGGGRGGGGGRKGFGLSALGILSPCKSVAARWRVDPFGHQLVERMLLIFFTVLQQGLEFSNVER